MESDIESITTFSYESSKPSKSNLNHLLDMTNSESQMVHASFLLLPPIDPYHSLSKQKILPVEPLIQCEAGRAKQSLYSPRTPKWPPRDKGELYNAPDDTEQLWAVVTAAYMV